MPQNNGNDEGRIPIGSPILMLFNEEHLKNGVIQIDPDTKLVTTGENVEIFPVCDSRIYESIHRWAAEQLATVIVSKQRPDGLDQSLVDDITRILEKRRH